MQNGPADVRWLTRMREKDTSKSALFGVEHVNTCYRPFVKQVEAAVRKAGGLFRGGAGAARGRQAPHPRRGPAIATNAAKLSVTGTSGRKAH